MVKLEYIDSNAFTEIGNKTLIGNQFNQVPIKTIINHKDGFLMFHISANIKHLNRRLTVCTHDTIINTIKGTMNDPNTRNI